MKKQILATALLSGLILVTFAPAASAIDKTADTKGSVQFEKVGENEVGEVVKPDTEDKPENIIVPEGGGNTTGPLRLQHVPDIKFGTVTFKTGNTKHQAILENYTKDGVAGNQAIPQFVQVTDERGDDTGTWKVTVSGTTFKEKVAGGGPATAPELANTKIVVKQQKFFNTVTDYATPVVSAETLVSGFTGTELTIPTNGTDSVLVMQTKAGKSTNGSKTSVVFNSDYTAASSYVVGEKNAGIILDKANGDNIVVDKAYESDLTWTLSDSI
nr:WxL domain-containing protein [Carnobacterium maltaromaticum]